MDIMSSTYYIRCQRYLRFYGHWPYQDLKNRIINLSLLMLLSATVIVPEFVKLFELRHNFQKFIVAVPSIFFYLQFVFKQLFAALRTMQIKKALDKIKRDFDVYKNQDLQVLHEYSREAYKINTFYTVYMFMAVSGYSMLPLTLHVLDSLLPRDVARLQDKPRLANFFFETLNENVYFIIIHGLIVDLTAIVFMIGFDTLTFAVCNHVCALFVIVAFVDTLESSFSALNLLSTGCAMIPLTITGFEVVMNNGNFGQMVRFVLFAVGEIVHLFYYNWPGQKIKDHSLLIYKACYNCEWYDEVISYKCKKLLYLMMVRSQKPCSLTAGKLYVLGLENFAAVVKVSMSYFTVLSSVM